ncbi:MAG: hypothetical protein SO002_03695 [Candidatus Faecousia sp.]|nr:hypothetical protein [Candidatus Faecousia sp.]
MKQEQIAGFRQEGILKSNAVKDGHVLDMVMYALTRDSACSPEK